MVRSLRPPLLVCVDFQREYSAPGRPLYIPGLDLLLAKASRILSLARAESWIIAHALMRAEGLLFGEQTEHARTLPGFEPRGAEMVFFREGFSVYGNKDFGRLLERNRGFPTLIMGVSGPYALLHTALDAHARCDALVVIEDVLGAPGIGPMPAVDIVAVARAVAGSMHRLVASDELVAQGACRRPEIDDTPRALVGGGAKHAC
jgi:hypothetical protein